MSGIESVKLTIEIECVPPFDTRGKHRFGLGNSAAYAIANMTPTQLQELRFICQNYIKVQGRFGPDIFEFAIPKRKP